MFLDEKGDALKSSLNSRCVSDMKIEAGEHSRLSHR